MQLQTRSEESLYGTHRRVVVVDDLRPVYRTVFTERQSKNETTKTTDQAGCVVDVAHYTTYTILSQSPLSFPSSVAVFGLSLEVTFLRLPGTSCNIYL
jgi:hypothetical protein